MRDDFEKLLEPGSIGSIRTRNRIIKTANGTSFMEPDQTVGPRMIAYYESLARGGVGFLVVESCGVEYPLGIQHVHYRPDGTYQGVQLHLDDDRFIPYFQRLTEAVHRHGCPVSIQLLHAGPWNPTGLLPRDPKVRDVKCASAMTEEELPGPDFLPCRAMTKQEIEDQVELWAAAAERAKKAGFDACELNHGTCHQGNTFLSRIWNKREDEYGPQSYENRTRFLRDIITEIKRRCGADFAVHVLINLVEYNHPLGTTMKEGVELAKAIATVADGINCRAERYGHRSGLLQPDRLYYPELPDDLPADLDWSRGGKGATVPLAAAVKKAGVRVPVWTAGRLDPVLGEECLRLGKLDFVGMTRRLLADPELPNKVRDGRLEDIRPCTGCLHCFDMRNKNKPMECRVNPTLGRETDPAYQAHPTAAKKKVMVVGGGPAGLEAARAAAEKGHEVVLYEKERRLGGLTRVAAVVKELEAQELLDLARYYGNQLARLGVRVHLGREATAATVKGGQPDVLILAVGPAHAPLAVPVEDARRVLSAERLHNTLRRLLRYLSPMALTRLSRWWMPVGPKVVILGGRLHGLELAEFLAKRGRSVVIAHAGPEAELGEGMTKDDLFNLWPWFRLKQVAIWPAAKALKISREGVWLQLSDKRRFLVRCRHVIDTEDLVPHAGAAAKFATLVPDTRVIGSAREPGLVVDAIREGALTGYSI